MLKIRLQRVGRKNDPAFRVIVTDHHKDSQSGKFLEVLGSYDVLRGRMELKTERVKHWLGVGARPSGTVHNLLIDQKILTGKKINVLPKRKPVAPAEKPAVETSQPAEPVAPAATVPVE